jgi:hypothetical protein
MKRSTDTLSRRHALAAALAAAPALTLGAQTAQAARPAARKRSLAALQVAAGKLPIDDPAFNVTVLGKLQGDLSGKVHYSYSVGLVFGLVPGEGPPLADYGRLLYRVEGVAVRMSRQAANGNIEERSRNWMFYRDAETGQYLDEFRNPYTGELLKVPTFRGGISGTVMTPNGPQVSANFSMESTVFNKPVRLDWRFVGDRALISRYAFTRWKESSSGNVKTEMTLDSWVCQIADLIDQQKLSRIPSTYNWTSQTEWQTWLGMKGRPGGLLWRIDRMLVSDIEELPRDFVERCEQLLPGKLSEPLSWES